MKDDLKSYLDSYKRKNDEASKEELYKIINSLTSPIQGYSGETLDAVDQAKQALTTRIGNKSNIVQSVENVISSLK